MSGLLRILIGAGLLLLLLMLPVCWVGSAKDRLAEDLASEEKKGSEVARAAPADEGYCSPDLKRILRRVLQSCGLVGGSGRGCRPLEARQVATMSGSDFNALFTPMAERGGIVQFDLDSSELDAEGVKLVDNLFADRRGASYFFIVARASPEGAVEHNRELSKGRAEAVLGHLQRTFQDAALEKQVGLLWLGAEYAQLEASFCEWRRSREDLPCGGDQLNRSAFMTWVDCTL